MIKDKSLAINNNTMSMIQFRSTQISICRIEIFENRNIQVEVYKCLTFGIQENFIFSEYPRTTVRYR